jgi:uncharacterized membrane protein YkvA (DUF1232 family)
MLPRCVPVLSRCANPAAAQGEAENMASDPQNETNKRPRTLSELFENAQIAWKLIRDPRLSPWIRFGLPLLAGAYLLMPIDIIPDVFLGLGQLDDLAVIWIAMQLLLRFAPDDIVSQYRSGAKAGPAKQQQSTDDVIDGNYRVVD